MKHIEVKYEDGVKYIMVKQNGETLWVPEYEYDAVMDGRQNDEYSR